MAIDCLLLKFIFTMCMGISGVPVSEDSCSWKGFGEAIFQPEYFIRCGPGFDLMTIKAVYRDNTELSAVIRRFSRWGCTQTPPPFLRAQTLLLVPKCFPMNLTLRKKIFASYSAWQSVRGATL